MEAFPRTVPLFSSDLCPAKGGPHHYPFHCTYFLEHDVLVYQLNAEVLQNTRESFPYLFTIPLSECGTESQRNSSRPFKTTAHTLCLSKSRLPCYLEGFLWKQNEIAEEAVPRTGDKQESFSNTTFLSLRTPIPLFTDIFISVFQFQERVPPCQRRKKEATQLLAIQTHHYSQFSSNFSSCLLPRAETCLCSATHFISTVLFCPWSVKSTQDEKKEDRGSSLTLIPPSY